MLPLPYLPHPSPAQTDTVIPLHTAPLHILTAVIPSVRLSCKYGLHHTLCTPFYAHILTLYPPHCSSIYFYPCCTVHTTLQHILPSVIPYAWHCCIYHYPIIPSTLLSCTYCPLSYSPAHTGHHYTFCIPLLCILPVVIPFTLLSCTY